MIKAHHDKRFAAYYLHLRIVYYGVSQLSGANLQMISHGHHRTTKYSLIYAAYAYE